MAAKHAKLIVRFVLVGILAAALVILVVRLMAPSTVTVENATGAELADVELRFTVDGTAVPQRIGALAPDEKRTVTLNPGSGDFPFAASYWMGPQKVNCDPGISIKGRGEHVILRISADKYEIVPE